MTRYFLQASALATAIMLMTAPATANHSSAIQARPLVLAQAEPETAAITDPVLQAENEVEEARTVLRAAMAGNGNVRKARRKLRKALERLEEAREDAIEEAREAREEAREDIQDARARKPDEPENVTEVEIPSDDQPGDEKRKKPRRVKPGKATTTVVLEPVAPEDEKPGEETLQAEDGRVITRSQGQLTIRHDDSDRLEKGGGRKSVERSADGSTTTTVVRPDGTQVVTVRDEDDEILKRFRRGKKGKVEVLIDETKSDRRQRRAERDDQPAVDLFKLLPRLVVSIPQQQYIVESRSASQRQIEEALIAPPVEQVERAYSLQEIRGSGRLRNKLRRIDLDTVTFEFGSAAIPPDQIQLMERIGIALSAVISRNPGEVYLIEGHTDAVGADISNLALSDRRAENVAEVLSYYFSIPPENLITQGFGEQFLKIPTAQAERQNRRVTLRRITPLLRTNVR